MFVEANQSLKLTVKTLAHFHGSLPQSLYSKKWDSRKCQNHNGSSKGGR